MPIAAVFLFGSLARADQTRGSDTDLLLVSDEAETRHVSAGHLSMFFYPWPQLLTEAQQGDLFVCHIVREAKALFDPEHRLVQLRNNFVLRTSYEREIAQATDLGWFLVRYGDELNSVLLVKRIIWCVRTILIARSAEAQAPVFSPQVLASRSNSAIARELLSERHNRRANATMRGRFQKFLSEETSFDPSYTVADRGDFLRKFDLTSNKVALQTIIQQQQSQSMYI